MGENTKINVDGKYDIVVNNFKELQEALGCIKTKTLKI